MRIAIVGAGFSGIITAKTLLDFGHAVVVFEKSSEVGGVWSSSRRYPGLTTQNTKDTYFLSDSPMPDDYPEWPTGEQVQAYLAAYCATRGLEKVIRLSTEVVSADVNLHSGRWRLQLQRGGDSYEEEFDHLCICNGTVFDPYIPSYAGVSSFAEAGGKLMHTADLHTLDHVTGKRVVVVGYGKSACDAALAIEGSAKSVTIVVRHKLWKVPKMIMGVLNYKYLLMTRLGEALFKPLHPTLLERIIHSPPIKYLRDTMVSSLSFIVSKQFNLGSKQVSLIPNTPFETVACSTISLVTDGFYERVKDGRIGVERDCEIQSLSGEGKESTVMLSNGRTLEADTVLCGTGYIRTVSFLPPHLMKHLTDADGNWLLYQHILPLSLDQLPNLTFNGYQSSLFNTITSEISALWIARYLESSSESVYYPPMALPSQQEQRKRVTEKLEWMERRTGGKHAHGTNVVPFSMHGIDELLEEVGVDVGWATKLKQWLLPVSPSDYAQLAGELRRKYAVIGRKAT